MFQKLKILNENIDKLDEINDCKFSFENFNQINSQLEKTLFELKSNELSFEKSNFTQDQLNSFKYILNKIEKLDSKITHKANLFESFSKSKT
tara:strand:- start:1471 stop:1746 length:276 start_codon:yes stop_codon:yes gene_type:complete